MQCSAVQQSSNEGKKRTEIARAAAEAPKRHFSHMAGIPQGDIPVADVTRGGESTAEGGGESKR